MKTILVTGFGPFPGAPINPTETLVASLARMRLPRAMLVTHVFPTRYDAVDRELPRLLGRHEPDALLMFGLAAQTPHLRIETWASNALSPQQDAGGTVPPLRSIAPGRAARLRLPTLGGKLVAAARRARVPAAISEDAGDYLCNYLCWQAATAARQDRGPRFAAFVHVPVGLAACDLARAGRHFLAVVAAGLR